jgi:HK97 family phage portal protein
MFGFKKRKEKGLEKQLKYFEAQISNQNELIRAFYDFQATHTSLQKDSNLKKYVTDAYEGNNDVFGILMTLSTIFSRMKYKLVKVQRNGKQVEVIDNDILKLLNRPNFFQNGVEFRLAWSLFKYVTGNAIVYAPKLEAGMNQGKINKDGLSMIPSQNVEIYSGGWREPIKYYAIDINVRTKISPQDVWHERFPSLQYEEGRNFMGLSPLKAALNVINVQNDGEAMAAKLYKGGHPPGIISKDEEGGTTVAEQESKFRSKWKNKYQKDIDIPIFTMGKLNYTKIGFDNFKDLQLLEMDEMGRKKLCIALGVPPELFGASQPTYSNMHDAKKTMYENRIIPDFEQFLSGINEEILPAYGDGLKLIPDYSGIEVLQEDKERKAKVYQIGVNVGAYSPDEYREAMGDEPTGEPAMQARYIRTGMIPIGMGEEQENKMYEQINLPDGR